MTGTDIQTLRDNAALLDHLLEGQPPVCPKCQNVGVYSFGPPIPYDHGYIICVCPAGQKVLAASYTHLLPERLP